MGNGNVYSKVILFQIFSFTLKTISFPLNSQSILQDLSSLTKKSSTSYYFLLGHLWRISQKRTVDTGETELSKCMFYSIFRRKSRLKRATFGTNEYILRSSLSPKHLYVSWFSFAIVTDANLLSRPSSLNS